MWNAFAQTCKNFGIYEDDLFFDWMLSSLQQAEQALADQEISPEQADELWHVCHGSLLDAIAYLDTASGRQEHRLFAISHADCEQMAQSDRGRDRVVVATTGLRTQLLARRLSFDPASLSNAIRGTISRDKVDLAIEKSAQAHENVDFDELDNYLIPIEVQRLRGGKQKLAEFFNDVKDFVLLGEAGTGKSWSLALYYDQLWGDFCNSKNPSWIPVFVAVDEVIEALEARLPDTISGEEAIQVDPILLLNCTLSRHVIFSELVEYPDMLTQLAEVGCFFLIFDGLNEIPNEKRKLFATIFNDFRRQFPHNRFIIASRRIHWNPHLFPEFKTVVEILKLDDDEIADFIRRFFGKKNRPEDGEKLIQLLTGRGMESSMTSLRKIAFFLDKIINLYAKRREIPKNRGDLFKDYLFENARFREWFPLQSWMLGTMGLYMLHIQKQYLSDEVRDTVARNLLFLGFSTGPSRFFEARYTVTEHHRVVVADGQNVNVGDMLAESKYGLSRRASRGRPFLGSGSRDSGSTTRAATSRTSGNRPGGVIGGRTSTTRDRTSGLSSRSTDRPGGVSEGRTSTTRDRTGGTSRNTDRPGGTRSDSSSAWRDRTSGPIGSTDRTRSSYSSSSYDRNSGDRSSSRDRASTGSFLGRDRTASAPRVSTPIPYVEPIRAAIGGTVMIDRDIITIRPNPTLLPVYTVLHGYEIDVQDGVRVEPGARLAHRSGGEIVAQVGGRVIIDNSAITISPPVARPEEMESFLEALGDTPLYTDDDDPDIEPYSEIFCQYTQRFNTDLPTIREAFEMLMENIRRNGYFEFEGTLRFIHQSIGEYYAALQFANLYQQDAAYLEDIIRSLKFDEMLHIVVGCVLAESQNLVGDILQTLLKKGSQLETVRDCLEKAEYVEDETKASLLELINKFIHDSLAPDRARGLAIECLPYLLPSHQRQQIDDLLTQHDLEEQAEAWSSLLSTTFDYWLSQSPSKSDDVSENIEAQQQFLQSLRLGLYRRRHRPHLLAATATWASQKRYRFVNELLREMLERQLRERNGYDLTSTIDTIWKAFTANQRSYSFSSSYSPDPYLWEALLDYIDDPDLYIKIFDYKHARRDLLCKAYFSEQKFTETIRRFGETEEFSSKLILSLTNLLPILGFPKKQVVKTILDICIRREEFASELIDAIWNVEIDIIFDLEIDLKTLAWCLQNDANQFAATISKVFDKALGKTTDPYIICRFRRDLSMLSVLADTPVHATADTLVKTMDRIVNACHQVGDLAYWQHPIYSNFAALDYDLVFAAFDQWDQLDDSTRAAWRMVIRKHKEAFDAGALEAFWRQKPTARFADILYMGGGDYFICEHPAWVRDVFSNTYGTTSDPILEKNIEYYQRLDSANSAYSTRIAIYQKLSGSSNWAYKAHHPGHPTPSKDSEALKSLIRLLRDNMTTEAAYILLRSKNLWDEIEQNLDPDLLAAFESAKDSTKYFTTGGASTVVRTIHMQDLRVRAVLNEIRQNTSWLQLHHIPVLLDHIYEEPTNSLFDLRIEILTKAGAWNKADPLELSQGDMLELRITQGLVKDQTRQYGELIRVFKRYAHTQPDNDSAFPPRFRMRSNRLSGDRWFGELGKLWQTKREWVELTALLDLDADHVETDDNHNHLLSQVIDMVNESALMPQSEWDEPVSLQQRLRRQIGRAARGLRSIEIEHMLRSIEYDEGLPTWWIFELLEHTSYFNLDIYSQGIAQLLKILTQQIGNRQLHEAMIADIDYPFGIDEHETISQLRDLHFPVVEADGKALFFRDNAFVLLRLILRTVEMISNRYSQEIDQADWTQIPDLIEKFEQYHLDPNPSPRTLATESPEYLILTLIILQSLRDWVDIDSAIDVILDERDHLQSRLEEAGQALSTETLDTLLELYPIWQALLDDEYPLPASLRDYRTVFFWRLRQPEFDWVTPKQRQNLVELFRKLPPTLQKSLGQDAMNALADERFDTTNWWHMLWFDVIQATADQKLELKEDYDTAVQHLLRVIEDQPPTQWDDSIQTISQGIVNIITKITERESVNNLEKILCDAVSRHPPTDDNQHTIVWANHKALGETVWGIVRGVAQQTQIKIQIAIRFDAV